MDKQGYEAEIRSQIQGWEEEEGMVDIQLEQFKKELEPLEARAFRLKEELESLNDDICMRKIGISKLELEKLKLAQRISRNTELLSLRSSSSALRV